MKPEMYQTSHVHTLDIKAKDRVSRSIQAHKTVSDAHAHTNIDSHIHEHTHTNSDTGHEHWRAHIDTQGNITHNRKTHAHEFS